MKGPTTLLFFPHAGVARFYTGTADVTAVQE